MANLTVGVSDLEIATALRSAQDALAPKLTAGFKAAAEYLELSVRDNFDAESSPDGVPWPSLSPRYAARKAANPRAQAKTLAYSGALRDTIVALSGSDFVRLTSALSTPGGGYSLAAIHQFGAPRRKIPARPFLGVNGASGAEFADTDVQEVQRILLAYL